MPRSVGGAWVLFEGGIFDAAGRAARLPLRPSDLPPACRGLTFPSLGGPRSLGNCLARAGWHRLITYQPASRFWTFQWIEAGIFVVLAGMALALGSWRALTADA